MEKNFQALEKEEGRISQPWKQMLAGALLVLLGAGCAAPKVKIMWYRPDGYNQYVGIVSERSDAWPQLICYSWVTPQIRITP